MPTMDYLDPQGMAAKPRLLQNASGAAQHASQLLPTPWAEVPARSRAEGFQKSGAPTWTPKSRALITRTPTKRTPNV